MKSRTTYYMDLTKSSDAVRARREAESEAKSKRWPSVTALLSKKFTYLDEEAVILKFSPKGPLVLVNLPARKAWVPRVDLELKRP